MTKKFINRKEEIDQLKELYQKTFKQEAQFLVLYGKRRIGKTELIRHFCKDKPHIYYLAIRTSKREQLKQAALKFGDYFKDNYFKNADFRNWREFFDYLKNKLDAQKEPLIIIFDEFPFLADSESNISSFFQYGWDMYLKNYPVFLILMGSSIAMMYKHALVYSAPLYGRRTGQKLLESFNFTQSTQFFPRKTNFEKLFSFYALVGGIPAYLKELDSKLSLRKNIIKNFFQSRSFLNIEPELLIAEEFNDPKIYLSILKAIGLGQTKYSQILNITKLPNNVLPVYLSNLKDLRLISKEVPITEAVAEKSKKGTYSIADNFLRFYFNLIFSNQSFIGAEKVDDFFSQNQELIKQLLAKAYEDTTQEFIQKAIKIKVLPHFNKLGRWWNNKIEIDLVGLNKDTNQILFVETKWNDKPLTPTVYYRLKEKAKEVKWGENGRKEYFALVAKGEFSPKLINLAKKKGIVLIEKDKVLKLSKHSALKFFS
jgi:hypothetical protein